MAGAPARDLRARPPPAPEAFLRPLDFLRDQHERQRALCDRIDEIAGRLEVGDVAEHAGPLLAFLTEELALHYADEERDLFPMLDRRCHREDEFWRIAAELRREHALDGDLVEFIVADLRVLAGGHQLHNPVRLFMNLRAFTEMQRRHLAWENAVVLPLAERRLRREDLEEIGRGMAARRGLAYPG